MTASSTIRMTMAVREKCWRMRSLQVPDHQDAPAGFVPPRRAAKFFDLLKQNRGFLIFCAATHGCGAGCLRQGPAKAIGKRPGDAPNPCCSKEDVVMRTYDLSRL